MTVLRCQRCGHWWATNAVGGMFIWRFCPSCIPAISHQLRDLEGRAA